MNNKSFINAHRVRQTPQTNFKSGCTSFDITAVQSNYRCVLYIDTKKT